MEPTALKYNKLVFVRKILRKISALTEHWSLLLHPGGRGFVTIPLPYTQGDLMRFEWAFGQIPQGPRGWAPGGSRWLMHKRGSGQSLWPCVTVRNLMPRVFAIPRLHRDYFVTWKSEKHLIFVFSTLLRWWNMAVYNVWLQKKSVPATKINCFSRHKILYDLLSIQLVTQCAGLGMWFVRIGDSVLREAWEGSGLEWPASVGKVVLR